MSIYTRSPLLQPHTPPGRSRFALACMLALFGWLALHALRVQVINRADILQKQSTHLNVAKTARVAPQRGRILDRHGQVLAQSVPWASIGAHPAQINWQAAQTPQQLRQLAALLELPEAGLRKKLQEAKESFIWLKRHADWTLGARVDALRMPGIKWDKEYKRHYPAGAAAVHVLGVTNVDDKGLSGLEQVLDNTLTGHGATRYLVKNRLQQVVESEEGLVVDGADVQLTLDLRVQRHAFAVVRQHVQENRAKAGSAVVLDARSGEVLALVNYPSYQPEPNRRADDDKRLNRAVGVAYEPGSIIKPFTVALALEQGKVAAHSLINAGAPWRVGRAPPITEAGNRSYGTISVAQVIAKSSNVGAAKIGMQLAAADLWAMYARLGFGQRPPIEIPGARAGSVLPLEKWTAVDQSRMAFGYAISTSLLHMARSYTVFANGGRILPLSIVKAQKGAPLPAGEAVFSPQTAHAVRSMLELTTEAGGTGRRARVPGYTVGGKSGTARKLFAGQYLDGKYHASFVGMAPISDPRLIVAVMIDEPGIGQGYGGAVAAPVVSEILGYTLQALGVPPDRSDEAGPVPLLASAPLPAR